MAVPKKRTGASAQGHRRANWKATVPAVTTCTNCNEVVLAHTVCPGCGYYKKAAVSIKNPNYVAPDATKKKVVKKAAKPAAVKAKKAEKPVEEVKIEEVAEVEEVKAEAVEEVVAEAPVEETVAEEAPVEEKTEE